MKQVGISPDGYYFVAIGDSSTVFVGTFNEKWYFFNSFSSPSLVSYFFWCQSLSRDSRPLPLLLLLLLSFESYFTRTFNSNVYVLNFAEARLTRTHIFTELTQIVTIPDAQRNSGGCHVCWSPDSRFCAISMNSGKMIVVNPFMKKIVWEWNLRDEWSTESDRITGGWFIEFSPKYPEIPVLICGSACGHVAVVNTNSWKAIKHLSYKSVRTKNFF